MFLHGGPGAACQKFFTHFFNPERYRVILFDQRGCGKSTPSASDDDATAALTDNTTTHLIDDVLRLRRELHIHGKMHVFGGSWGSTLAGTEHARTYVPDPGSKGSTGNYRIDF